MQIVASKSFPSSHGTQQSDHGKSASPSRHAKKRNSRNFGGPNTSRTPVHRITTNNLIIGYDTTLDGRMVCLQTHNGDREGASKASNKGPGSQADNRSCVGSNPPIRGWNHHSHNKHRMLASKICARGCGPGIVFHNGNIAIAPAIRLLDNRNMSCNDNSHIGNNTRTGNRLNRRKHNIWLVGLIIGFIATNGAYARDDHAGKCNAQHKCNNKGDNHPHDHESSNHQTNDHQETMPIHASGLQASDGSVLLRSQQEDLGRNARRLAASVPLTFDTYACTSQTTAKFVFPDYATQYQHNLKYSGRILQNATIMIDRAMPSSSHVYLPPYYSKCVDFVDGVPTKCALPAHCGRCVTFKLTDNTIVKDVYMIVGIGSYGYTERPVPGTNWYQFYESKTASVLYNGTLDTATLTGARMANIVSDGSEQLKLIPASVSTYYPFTVNGIYGHPVIHTIENNRLCIEEMDARLITPILHGHRAHWTTDQKAFIDPSRSVIYYQHFGDIIKETCENYICTFEELPYAPKCSTTWSQSGLLDSVLIGLSTAILDTVVVLISAIWHILALELQLIFVQMLRLNEHYRILEFVCLYLILLYKFNQPITALIFTAPLLALVPLTRAAHSSGQAPMSD